MATERSDSSIPGPVSGGPDLVPDRSGPPGPVPVYLKTGTRDRDRVPESAEVVPDHRKGVGGIQELREWFKNLPEPVPASVQAAMHCYRVLSADLSTEEWGEVILQMIRQSPTGAFRCEREDMAEAAELFVLRELSETAATALSVAMTDKWFELLGRVKS